MSGRKKKLSVKLKRYNIMLIVVLSILMLLLFVLMIVKMVGKGDFYKVESRISNIEKSRKNDKSDFQTIGWVRVQGTNIDYPVYGIIQEGYEYPVTESYLWSLNMDSDFHDTMLIYGHNVMNLGPHPITHDESFIRMEELMNFVYFDFAKENQYIQFTIDGEDYLYKIFAVNFIEVLDYEEYPDGEWSSDNKEDYVDRLLEESIYDYNDGYQKGDKILSVVTCSRFFEDGVNYDFIVTGRLVRLGESIKKTSVLRNKNYVKIGEILKGADEDEESTKNA